MLVSIKKASQLLGVSQDTLRKWERKGKITPEYTAGGHRRYDSEQLIKAKEKNDGILYTAAYCRVPKAEQKEDLIRQVDTVSAYCASRGYQFKVISDVGIGMNCQNPGLKKLIDMICNKEINRIVLNYKDRLYPYGYEMIEQICALHDVQIEIINLTEDHRNDDEIISDAMFAITSFSSKIYGENSPKAEKILRTNKEMWTPVEPS